ncbi:TFIIB-type zinc ribbon-containing protein [Mogibacterium timidum]|uniref:TFIIB zinc-binding domain protein n=1 Tax=Mogibacterium timidum ATCC 33093 TaxID=1401079 RepID=X8J7Z3_9FIRM|nr:TFIIB-type zinc ribbon-containing protein [Mogibacterium timidum]EUC58022.1 hypothetical protein HMPREF0581_1313 [Mogibacterium timidum ATCC 33093]
MIDDKDFVETVNEGVVSQDNTTEEQVGEERKDGQIKCPKCGATDIELNPTTGKLRCNFCRHVFEPEVVEQSDNIAELEGLHTSKGASDIIADAEDVLTLKCESCGAEVVIDTASAGQARCHWCRNMLSINSAIPNGAVPDVVLPFNVTKVDAQAKIDEFVGKRKFFAHPQFTKEFTSENICGVYFPYMIIDVNAHSYLSGTGEKLVRKYTVKNGDREEDRYDADAYHVERDFDITIDDLTVEASADKLNVSSNEKTTNIINSIMPFDTDKCVEYNANYLRGYTSQKRDVNVDHIRQLVKTQSNDIARFAANDTLEKYDRGVAWDIDNFEVKGESWNAAYLPVWLYSYMQVKGKKNLLHYVAVNARTKETMGSVPINMTKLWIVSIIIELFGGVLAILLGSDLVKWDSDYRWALLLPGAIFFAAMYSRYRNAGARHTYEKETVKEMSNISMVDEFTEHRRGLKDEYIKGVNNNSVKGSNVKDLLPGVKADSLSSVVGSVSKIKGMIDDVDDFTDFK